MPKRFHKHRVLLDENLPPRAAFRLLNSRFDVKHIEHDFHHGGHEDLSVYQLAVAQNRTIVTFNVKHFRPLVGTEDDAGVIGLPGSWATPQLDAKLTAVFNRTTPKQLQKKYVALSGQEVR